MGHFIRRIITEVLLYMQLITILISYDSLQVWFAQLVFGPKSSNRPSISILLTKPSSFCVGGSYQTFCDSCVRRTEQFESL